MRPDDLTKEQLHQAVALIEGAGADPWELFLRVACVMERWGRVYVVSVKMPEKVAGLTVWMTGQGDCPLEACMRAYLKSRVG